MPSVLFGEMVLVGFAEEDAPKAGSTGEDAIAGGLVFKGGVGGDTADSDLQVFFNLGLDRGVAGPMGEGEAAVNLGPVSVLRGKEIVEVGFGIDFDSVLVPELFGALVQAGLDL